VNRVYGKSRLVASMYSIAMCLGCVYFHSVFIITEVWQINSRLVGESVYITCRAVQYLFVVKSVVSSYAYSKRHV
jgi:hypothetical protein